MTQLIHVPFFSLFNQWLKKSMRVSPAQIVKRNLRWRHLPYRDPPPPRLWEKNSKRNERAPRKGLLLWAKPIDKCPLLASSRGSELLSLLGQRCGVVRKRPRHANSRLLCKFIQCLTSPISEDCSPILYSLYYWFLTKRKSPGGKRQMNI